MSTYETALPCPFCGSPHVVWKPKHRDDDGSGSGIVECVCVCRNCGAHGPLAVRNGSKNAFSAARKRWNERAV